MQKIMFSLFILIMGLPPKALSLKAPFPCPLMCTEKACKHSLKRTLKCLSKCGGNESTRSCSHVFALLTAPEGSNPHTKTWEPYYGIKDSHKESYLPSNTDQRSRRDILDLRTTLIKSWAKGPKTYKQDLTRKIRELAKELYERLEGPQGHSDDDS